MSNYKVIVLSLLVSSSLLTAEDNHKPHNEKSTNAKEVKKKKLKHFHDPFCVCDKSPLFSKHKYDGKVHGYLRAHHIFAGEDNGFDKDTGSTVGLGLRYNLKLNDKFSVGAEYYGVTDSGLTDEDKTIAYGQFMNEDLSYGDTYGLHLSYKDNGYTASIARSQFDSPLTKTHITHVPNMFEFIRVDKNIDGTQLSFSYIDKMAYGSRSAADFGLIGEKTGTAGMSLNPFKDVERGKYYSMEKIVGEDTKGIAIFGAEKSFENFNVQLWDYYAQNAGNNFYAESEIPLYLKKGYGLGIHFQFLNQQVDKKFEDKYGGNFYGVKVNTKMKKLKVNFAYNKKDDKGGFHNPSGANMGYTSSIFSRNEYRAGVDAYKVTAMYPIMKGLKVIVSHADYGQSDMTLNRGKDKPALASQTDAKESNLIVVYKPMKNLSFKLFNANRTSEFSTSKKERTQNHTRLIVNYKF